MLKRVLPQNLVKSEETVKYLVALRNLVDPLNEAMLFSLKLGIRFYKKPKGVGNSPSWESPLFHYYPWKPPRILRGVALRLTDFVQVTFPSLESWL